jgi:hypothetical protein
MGELYRWQCQHIIFSMLKNTKNEI